MATNLPPGVSPAEIDLKKGAFGGFCNRVACLRPGADWFNIATRAYYCRECAELINYPGGRADAKRLYGRELLCEAGEHQPNDCFIATLPTRPIACPHCPNCKP